MSTYNQTSNDFKSELLFSHRVQTERRSFFFHVKKAPEGEPYLTIGQYARLGDEWVRLKVVIPAEDAKVFYQGLCQGLKAMRSFETATPGKQEAETSPPSVRARSTKSGRQAAAGR